MKETDFKVFDKIMKRKGGQPPREGDEMQPPVQPIGSAFDYSGDLDERRKAMLAFIGIRKPRPGDVNALEEVRRLRRGTRMDRIFGR